MRWLAYFYYNVLILDYVEQQTHCNDVVVVLNRCLLPSLLLSSPSPANRCHLFTSIVTENDIVLTKRPCDCPFLVADRSVARHIVSRYVLKQPQDQGC